MGWTRVQSVVGRCGECIMWQGTAALSTNSEVVVLVGIVGATSVMIKNFCPEVRLGTNEGEREWISLVKGCILRSYKTQKREVGVKD